MSFSRRQFVKNIVTASCALPFSSFYNCGMTEQPDPNKLDVSIFSKHLQFLDFKATGQMAAELGFNGVDLTVRPKGHVLPENVATDLPKAVREIKQSGSICKMITTSIESIDNPHDVAIIKTAGQNRIAHYRTHWYKYHKDLSMTQSIDQYQKQIYELAELNKKHNIVGCYQNHAGTKIGASYWEIQKLLEKADPKYFGTQYDIRHATVDSGYSWTNGLELLHKQIKVIVLKDFKWGKVGNKWKEYGLKPPVSLHLEYPLGGAEKGKYEITVDRKVVYDAMTKDLNAIQKLWKDA